ncbi:MAG: hypothetical protein HQL32_08250 [Planctomycetes bacterium]|nr:hypothetical protein [Planctomycetota bacterium]
MMKLSVKAKVLWIPISAIVLSYVLLAMIIMTIIADNSERSRNAQLSELVQAGKKHLHTGLALITANQGPGDAFLGLEGEDDLMAKDLMQQVSSMGLNQVVFTDLDGVPIYPNNINLPDKLTAKLKQSSQSNGDILSMYCNHTLYGFSPIVDVETAKGYLVFGIEIPVSMDSIAEEVLKDDRVTKENLDATLTSEHLGKVYTSIKTDSDKLITTLSYSLLIILVIAVVLIVSILSFSSQKILYPINLLLKAFRKQETGNLTQEAKVDLKCLQNDELKELAEGFNKLTDKLRKIILQMHDSSISISSASSDLSSTATQQASSASEQAAIVSETSSTIEELAVTSEMISTNAEAIVTHSKELSKGATDSQTAIGTAFASMSKIRTSSENCQREIYSLSQKTEAITQVIGTINDIANTTKLISVNASIESARAGEEGKAFSIVAIEVRNLALKVSQSTANIKSLLNEIEVGTNSAIVATKENASKVQMGEEAINIVGDHLHNIILLTKDAEDLAHQINEATQQQYTGTEHVVSSIKEVETVAQQSSQAASLSADSTEKMNGLVNEIKDTIIRFKLE